MEDDARTPGYAWYGLGILVLVYILNFVDRQLLSILAEDIKRDLGMRDEDLGFLYGTAFGVFYALFGIPLGRLADQWHRVRLLASGLALWSAMTMVSGVSRGGAMLAAARVGVGVGEASAAPSAYSLISDWFPKRLRATALAIYSAGLYIGGGVSLGIGALIVQRWNAAYPVDPPLGLHGWQAAFLIVGLPGLLLALLVLTLREPARPGPAARAPFAAFFAELLTILPPLTLIGAARRGPRALVANLAAVALLIGFVAAAGAMGESVPQWSAWGIGVYAIFSWASALRERDPQAFALIVANPAFLAVLVAYGLNAFLGYSTSFWLAPYAERVLGEAKTTAGLIIGASGALGGFLGTTIGGAVADALRRRHPAGRVMVIIFGAIAPLPFIVTAFTTHSPAIFYAMVLPLTALGSCALGAAAATTQDLVLPRMRGTATATFLIGTTLLGLALGPYLAGRLSSASGSLSLGVLGLLATVPIALGAAITAFRLVPRYEARVAALATAP
ncbi:MAG: MFS transporter [Proteobacteria bacterium SG_bin5]|nr:MFS transporter [Sphingomonas sp.]OQW39651.1 MAG: MFS transporter [Proteobacteria bacterium SG_bin5]